MSDWKNIAALSSATAPSASFAVSMNHAREFQFLDRLDRHGHGEGSDEWYLRTGRLRKSLPTQRRAAPARMMPPPSVEVRRR